jgi:hypothetical protein
MQLRATIIDKFFDGFLATVEVESDTAEPWGDGNFRRRVTGKVVARGPVWNEFLGVWFSEFFRPMKIDGKDYFTVSNLQVDHDHYGLHSWVNLEESDIIRLILIEHFEGTVEDYYRTVRERNQRVQAFWDKWQTGNVTANDLRELSGYERLDIPHLNARLSPEKVAEARKVYSQGQAWWRESRNLVV